MLCASIGLLTAVALGGGSGSAVAGMLDNAIGIGGGAETNSVQTLTSLAETTVLSVHNDKSEYDKNILNLKIALSYHKIIGPTTVIHALNHMIIEKFVHYEEALKVAQDLDLAPAVVSKLDNGSAQATRPNSANTGGVSSQPSQQYGATSGYQGGSNPAYQNGVQQGGGVPAYQPPPNSLSQNPNMAGLNAPVTTTPIRTNVAPSERDLAVRAEQQAMGIPIGNYVEWSGQTSYGTARPIQEGTDGQNRPFRRIQSDAVIISTGQHVQAVDEFVRDASGWHQTQ